MKKRIFTSLKIYFITIIYTICISFIYSFYIMKTSNNTNPIIELIIGGSSFLVLGLLFANHLHKRGLIAGIIISFLTIFLIKICYLLTGMSIEFNVLPSLIYILSGGIGGILGCNFKKII